ncbi:amino acid ABC transporter permease [Oceanibaculum indicum]|uniref:Polar amino acid ABC transporter inner membrane subunit n=1 Tax=Oceanibaculum indicum P24 TaxID=1207063 RepID=K2J3Q1_9PROT|nr:amino acid ABC transporter permease [Oceanibaculum indicum]EKE77626.1 polar amino acid ABC transporter inner membrane subunit [Oceanibaculum indicum P24]
MAMLEKGSPARETSFALMVNDERYRSVFYQIVAFALIVWCAWFLFTTTSHNLATRGMSSGFDFLGNTAGFAIAWHIIPYEPSDTYGRVYLVGITNTLIVSVVAIFFTTILGFVVGILRLSSNWLIAKLAAWYVEILRNTPLLLQILFWYLAVFSILPRPRDSLNIFGVFELNNRGFYMPSPLPGDLFWVTVLALLGAIVATIALAHHSNRKQASTGQRIPVLWPSLGMIIVLPLLVFIVTGAPLSFDYPVLQGFNFTGGTSVPPAFCSLLIALVVYHSAFIAENVRAGIQSVSHGQTEASYSLGLRPGLTVRLIVIPQAMRAIVPPLISVWMNVVKNSSLAVAIGFPDLVSVFMQTSLNQSGYAIEIVAMVMLFYMTVSLTISAALNVYNKSVQLKER